MSKIELKSILSWIIAPAIGLLIAVMQIVNQYKLNDIQSEIEKNQLKIQQSQMASDYLPTLINGSERERKMALLFLKISLTEDLINEIGMIIAEQDTSYDVKKNAIEMLEETQDSKTVQIIRENLDKAEELKLQNRSTEAAKILEQTPNKIRKLNPRPVKKVDH